MSPQERNRQTVQSYYDAFSDGDIERALACFAPVVRNHGHDVPRTVLRAILGDIRTRFPDARTTADEMVAVDDDVIVRLTYSGTHLGVGRLPIDGGLMVGVPPTGRSFAVQHIHWFRLADGLIVEHRANRDDVGMMVQLGLLPAPPRFEIPES